MTPHAAILVMPAQAGIQEWGFGVTCQMVAQPARLRV